MIRQSHDSCLHGRHERKKMLPEAWFSKSGSTKSINSIWVVIIGAYALDGSCLRQPLHFDRASLAWSCWLTPAVNGAPLPGSLQFQASDVLGQLARQEIRRRDEPGKLSLLRRKVGVRYSEF